MSNRSAMYLIMTLVAFIIICGIVSCSPGHAARGCLERDEAQRTWPTRQLGVDEEGCWTYLRRGITVPKPPRIDVPSFDMPVEGPAHISVEVAAALDLMQRWPTVIELQPPAEPPPPLMTPRNVATALAVLVLTIAVFEVSFGGMRMRR